MKNSTVYCLINVRVCSCFATILKFCIFSIITHSRKKRDVVMVWRVATLPMSCYMVRRITTRRMPQSDACCLRTSQPLMALYFQGSTEYYAAVFLRMKALICGFLGSVIMWSHGSRQHRYDLWHRSYTRQHRLNRSYRLLQMCRILHILIGCSLSPHVNLILCVFH